MPFLMLPNVAIYPCPYYALESIFGSSCFLHVVGLKVTTSHIAHNQIKINWPISTHLAVEI